MRPCSLSAHYRSLNKIKKLSTTIFLKDYTSYRLVSTFVRPWHRGAHSKAMPLSAYHDILVMPCHWALDGMALLQALDDMASLWALDGMASLIYHGKRSMAWPYCERLTTLFRSDRRYFRGDNSKRSIAWPYYERSIAWPYCERLMARPQKSATSL